MSKTPPTTSLGIFWRDVPLVNYALYSVGIAHAEITNLPVQRLDFVPTAIFPLLIPLLIYGLRWKQSTLPEKRVAIGICLGVPLLIGLNYVFSPRVVLSHDELRDIYEVSAIFNTFILMVHAWTHHRRWLGFFLGPCLAYGLLLENSGILLGYFSEMNYRWYLGPLPAPVATVSGWVTVYYIITWCVWEAKKCLPFLGRSAMGAALVAVAAALCFDLQVDPLACEVGFWTWHPSLKQGWLGVPLLNYAAWTAAVFPFAWILFRREAVLDLEPGEITEPLHRKWMFIQVPLALALAGILFFGFMVVIEGGFDGPTFEILDEAFKFYLG